LSIYYAVVGICWIAFFAAWAILAIVFGQGGRRNYSSMSIGVRLILAVIVVIGIRFASRAPTQDFSAYMGRMAGVGTGLCIIGLAFAIWARVLLGRNWGMPMTLHEDPELVTTGPYRYVRHPIYTGLIAMFIGTSLVYSPVALPGMFVIAYSLYSAVREERDMRKRFPEAYTE
jgi:protein-S-isoprenylcysteine O-methyltransferase Ste14